MSFSRHKGDNVTFENICECIVNPAMKLWTDCEGWKLPRRKSWSLCLEILFLALSLSPLFLSVSLFLSLPFSHPLSPSLSPPPSLFLSISLSLFPSLSLLSLSSLFLSLSLPLSLSLSLPFSLSFFLSLSLFPLSLSFVHKLVGNEDERETITTILQPIWGHQTISQLHFQLPILRERISHRQQATLYNFTMSLQSTPRNPNTPGSKPRTIRTNVVFLCVAK